jgi:hypothetical protein
MSRRRKFLLLAATAALGAVVVLVVLLVPDLRWGVLGLVRGESYYKGYPTSYWRARILDEREKEAWAACSPSRFAQLLNEAGLGRHFLPVPGIALENPGTLLFDGSAAAVPVLLELVEDPDEGVRTEAAAALKEIDPAAAKAAGVP